MLPARPAPELVLTTRASTVSPALTRSRQWLAAWWIVAKVPFRWTRMTASHSSSCMLTIIRSRTMPALLTSVSRRPHWATAEEIRWPAPSKEPTSSPLAMASPPRDRMMSTTSPAGPVEPPCPSSSAPTSLTTTRAPWRANSRAWARPIPRPAPVMITTRPSQMPTGAATLFRDHLERQRGDTGLVCRTGHGQPERDEPHHREERRADEHVLGGDLRPRAVGGVHDGHEDHDRRPRQQAGE